MDEIIARVLRNSGYSEKCLDSLKHEKSALCIGDGNYRFEIISRLPSDFEMTLTFENEFCFEIQRALPLPGFPKRSPKFPVPTDSKRNAFYIETFTPSTHRQLQMQISFLVSRCSRKNVSAEGGKSDRA